MNMRRRNVVSSLTAVVIVAVVAGAGVALVRYFLREERSHRPEDQGRRDDPSRRLAIPMPPAPDIAEATAHQAIRPERLHRADDGERRAVTARGRFQAALTSGRYADAEEIIEFMAGRDGNEIWVDNARRRLDRARGTGQD
jgi:hypothetical protein